MVNLIRLLCLLLLMHTTKAQVVSGKLREDPVFSTVLSRRIAYPTNAEHLGIYAKIYAGFRIDQKGRIQDISILNPIKVGYGFEEEVTKKLKKLPPLNPKYEGEYALPVTFALIDYDSKGKPVSSSGNLSNTYIKDRLLLNELKVIGNKTPVYKGNELAPYRAGTTEPVEH